MTVFVHQQGLCESAQVGEGTRIWAFAHVLPGARIGRDCNICDHVFIENDVVLGDRVTVKCGVQLWDGLRVDDDVFIGPNVTFTNDPFPRSKQRPAAFSTTRIGKGASIGANATILPGTVIGREAMVGAGTVVTGNVPARALVTGNPGRIAGYVDALEAESDAPVAAAVQAEKVRRLRVRGVALHRLSSFADLRGSLAVGHFDAEVPFPARRFFVVHDVPSKHVRGEHAHRRCHQFLICVRGAVRVLVDDGTISEEVVLSGPSLGLYVPPMIWSVQYKYSEDGTLLVFASDPYDPDDYIRDYEDFARLANSS
jgi:UDP-2-acetamido-3-amino-2,3-dideoxy-glucuronate N-acetyltransferase